MRLCRYRDGNEVRAAFYEDDRLIPLSAAAALAGVELPAGDSLLPLTTCGSARESVRRIEEELARRDAGEIAQLAAPTSSVELEVPVPDPSKLLLLAGNYAKHVEETGFRSEERARTFPYVFMKPPSTTLTRPGDPVRLPVGSPDKIDWELELAVIIGRRCRNVTEQDALAYVAGYTIVNDISDRGFRPNVNRTQRDKDQFFDWLHGKWHDTFCPMGPCLLPADELADPQTLAMRLTVNGHVEQEASTAEMVFPVAAVIEFVSSFVTLEPGDVISTGTPQGVGMAKGKFLRPGDVLEASIERIGVLRNPVAGEAK
ncbi:MAG: fumarylacetoacetate hydrolase family protein [Planctomycetaceae bacterium]